MTSREHPTATITTPNSTPGQSGRFGSESVAAFVGMRSVGGNRAGEVRIGRFLRNEKVTVEKIVEQALLDTASRVDGLHILAIQDTTSFRDDGSGNSLVGHSTIAVEAEHGALLGLIDAQIIERSGSGERLPRKRALRDKQSQRWIDGMQTSATPDDVGGTGDGGCRPGR